MITSISGRCASAAAVLIAGTGLAIAGALPAEAAAGTSATGTTGSGPTAGAVSVADKAYPCGFSFKNQSFHNCSDSQIRAVVYYVSSFPGEASSGSVKKCIRPHDTIYGLELVGVAHVGIRADYRHDSTCTP